MTDQPDDKIFDALLEEALTNQHPPDLSDLIQQRLREELGPEAWQQLRNQRLRYASVRPSEATSAASAAKPASMWMTVCITVSTLAAGLLVAIAIWQFAGRVGQPSSHTTVATKDPTTQATSVEPAERRVPDASLAGTPTEKQAAPSTNGNKGKDLPLDNLPFNKDLQLPEFSKDRNLVKRPATRLESEEIVQWIDGQFDQLWQSKQLTLQPPVSEDVLMQRIAGVLAGPQAPASGQSPRELADKLVRTATFAERWADRIVAFWLRGTPAADAQDPAGKSLRAFVAQQIVARKPWNQVLGNLVGSSPDQPESAFLASLAGGDNHRLAGRIGGALLDEALQCARCHDASENGQVISLDQDEYWSLVALLNGVDAQVTKNEGINTRTLIDKQRKLFEGAKSPNVFFDRPDGRLQAAHYRLPGGDNWRSVDGVQTPREALGKWIASTSVTDEAAVNLGWRLVFGRPLVAYHAALDGEGIPERRAILEKLAEQFQAHDRDMGLLVSWLVQSKPFSTQPLDVDRSRWLVASDEQVELWNVALATFAVSDTPPEPEQSAQSLASALALLDRWSDTRDERRATLAQPLPGVVRLPKPTPSNQVSEPASGYLVRSLKPTASQSDFIRRLAGSKLTWAQQVDHIAALIGEQPGNARLQAVAQKTLDAKNGDRAAALFQLLQGAWLCNESL